MNDPRFMVQSELGSELRTARKQRKISTRSAASHLGVSHASLARTELGQRTVQPDEVIALCMLYGISGKQRDHMVQRARNDQVSRTQDPGPIWASTAAKFIALEAEASAIIDLSTTWVPGILQTPEYMREVICDGGLTEAQEEHAIRTRLSRQSLLYARSAPFFRLIIDECVLRRPVGGAEVMRPQLEQVQRIAKRSNIAFQVIPYAVGGHSGLHGPFMLMEFPERSTHVYMDARSTGVFLSQPEYVEPFVTDLNLLDTVLLDEQDSQELVAEIQREFRND